MGVFSGFEHIVRDHEPLAQYTWFRLGGAAEYFAEPTSLDELAALVRRAHEAEMPVRLLGGGSNILVRDEGTRGLVIHLSAAAFGEISTNGSTATAGGGAKLAHLISTCAREGLAGLEQLVGIPGTVGGALHGNAGTDSGDIGQWTESAVVMLRSGEMVTRSREDLRFRYRESSLDELVILTAKFQLEREDPQVLTKRMQKLWIVKKSGQPVGNQNTGCVFKNPDGASAAALIEQAGLKGFRAGQVEVCGHNPNFFVASSGATSREAWDFVQLVAKKVLERTGIELQPQIEVW